MDTNTPRLFDLAADIAAEMTTRDGHPWTVEDRRDADRHQVPWPVIVGTTPRGPEPVRLIVREGYDVGAGRVEFLATCDRLPGVDVREYPTPPRIGVSAARPASAIAADVLRRIAGDAAGFAQEAAQVTARITRRAVERDEAAAKLAALTRGGSIHWTNSPHAPTPAQELTVYVLNGPRFDVRPGGSIRCDFHAYPKTPEQAAALAELLASWED